jgi:hypothetical protein
MHAAFPVPLPACCREIRKGSAGETAYSDEAGHAFQFEAGHPFRLEAGQGSDLKSATWRAFRRVETMLFLFFELGQARSGKSRFLWARREAVPVVNRRDPRARRRALAADAVSRAGGTC